MKQEQVKLLIQDITEIEQKLSEKYNSQITLTFKIRSQSIDAILNTVNQVLCKYVNVENADIRNKTNNREYVLFRHLFMYIAKEKKYTSFEIGECLQSARSNTTHAYRKIEHKLKIKDKVTCSQYELIIGKLK